MPTEALKVPFPSELATPPKTNINFDTDNPSVYEKTEITDLYFNTNQ